MKSFKYILIFPVLFIAIFFLASCNTKEPSKNTEVENNIAISSDKPVVLIYYFHLTNRCPSCIAIEKATLKTINTYFAEEQKQGRIRFQALNDDDTANNEITTKYQAAGSALFVTQLFKGKENTSDLTGDGFKYARNKEDKFIEILKNQITKYLNF